MSGNGVIEEVKSKLDIVQLISEYLPLRKAGIRFKAPCPFHHEKDPSFYVNPDWQIWHCFGCNEGGDIFDFVMRMEGLEFGDALRQLAQKAGVVLKPEDVGKDKERQRLFDVNRVAALYYREVLRRLPIAENARAYAARRQLQESTIDEFMIGYSPEDWTKLYDFLRKKDFTEQEIVSAGLAGHSEHGSIYDRFRNRLMFPIRNAQGQYVGFSGRIMPGADGKDPEGAPKYINTIETPVYRKSDVLFAFDLARQEMRKSGAAVVVEGNMDAVASHQAGVKNVVASSGTAFTAEQLTRLRRVADKLILSFDNDAAGEQAARRSIDAAVAAGFEVRVLRLPPGSGKDPDDCIRRDPELWKKAISDAVPHTEWFFELVAAKVKADDPYAKRRAAVDLLGEIAKLPTAVERSHWLRRLAEMFGADEKDLSDELLQVLKKKLLTPLKPRAAASGAVVSTAATEAPVKNHDRGALVAQYAMGLAVGWPELADVVVAEVDASWVDTGVRPLYSAIILDYNKRQAGKAGNMLVGSAVDASVDPNIREQLAILQLLAEKEFGDMTPDARRHETAKLIGEIKDLHAAHLKRELITAMRQAERDGDAVKIAELERQLSDLII